MYVSRSLSTAALEVLVHAGNPDAIPRDELAIRVLIPNDMRIERVELEDLPAGWQEPDHPSCVTLGDSWLRSGLTAVLEVPSAVVPIDRNLVLNPKHPESQHSISSKV